jgi:hypothetical protein
MKGRKLLLNVGIIMLVGVLICVACVLFGGALESSRKPDPLSQLHYCGLGIRLYREDHAGEPPSALETLLSDGIISDSDVIAPWENRAFIYRPLPPRAPGSEPQVYLWPPVKNAVAERRPQCLALTKDLVAGGMELTDRDLAVAARELRRGPEDVLLSFRHDLVNAVRLCAAEHDGRFPDDFAMLLEAGYITDELAWDLEREGVRYVRPTLQGAGEIVACLWPPEDGTVPVLYMDRTIGHAQVRATVRNPGTDESVALTLVEDDDVL